MWHQRKLGFQTPKLRQPTESGTNGKDGTTSKSTPELKTTDTPLKDKSAQWHMAGMTRDSKIDEAGPNNAPNKSFVLTHKECHYKIDQLSYCNCSAFCCL